MFVCVMMSDDACVWVCVWESKYALCTPLVWTCKHRAFDISLFGVQLFICNANSFVRMPEKCMFLPGKCSLIRMGSKWKRHNCVAHTQHGQHLFYISSYWTTPKTCFCFCSVTLPHTCTYRVRVKGGGRERQWKGMRYHIVVAMCTKGKMRKCLLHAHWWWRRWRPQPQQRWR